MDKEQQYYQRLAANRARSRKDIGSNMQKQGKYAMEKQGEHSKKYQLALARRRSALRKKMAKADKIGQMKNLPLAFTAVDFSKDAIHFIVIIVSVIADLLTLIPIVGNFFSIVFSIIIWTLYAMGGHLKRRVGRKVVITSTSQALEIFGFAINGLPFFTISAIVNYVLALAERKTVQQAQKKAA